MKSLPTIRMLSRKYLTIFCVGLMGIVVLTKTAIAADDHEVASLKDLEGVYIQVVLGEKIINHGLSTEQVETEFKPKLESAGIKMLSLEALRETPGSPILIVEAESVETESLSSAEKTLYSFVVGVSLHKLVDTDKKGVPIGQSVWDIQDRGVTYDLKDVRLYIKRLLFIFAKSYQKANP